MGRNREYEYDQITKKLLKGPKGPPEIIKGEAKETPRSSKTKHTYVPQSTDAAANMEEPSASEDLTEDFYGGVNDVAQKAVNTRAYIKGKMTCVRWWMITFKNTSTNAKSSEERIQIGDAKKWQQSLLMKS
ncbi:unnamed protein product [Phytophthora lilii]|uniref:Unnamed protein product n=1 Tax=Phytophthora lilii TaxID=2077276 RepID=A0A9W6XDI6_9STRA|nr:unnamed protein product [Phytophthora lilii]